LHCILRFAFSHPQVGLRLAGAHAVLVSRAEWAQFVLIDGADAFTKKGTAFFPVRCTFCVILRSLHLC
jgi:hypothetical protein